LAKTCSAGSAPAITPSSTGATWSQTLSSIPLSRSWKACTPAWTNSRAELEVPDSTSLST